MKIGAKINVFNAELREARKRLSMSQADLAEAIGEQITTVQFIETIKQPTIRFERLKDILLKISDVLNVEFDILFPEDYLFALQNKYLPDERNLIIVRDVNILSLPAGNQFLQLPAPDEIVETEQMQKQVTEVLETLPEREQKIIKHLYGFSDGEKHTLEETAREFHETRERIRQIEAQALSRMRHPKLRMKIRDYING
jgi:RNA polymerase sigma factor (sigma-70 family)